MSRPPLIYATELPGCGGGLASAAAVAVRLADGDGVVVAELAAERPRGPTMLASEPARELERRLREAGFDAAARGRLAWLTLPGGDEDVGDDDRGEWRAELKRALEVCAGARALVAWVPSRAWGAALAAPGLRPEAALVRAEPATQRSLAALAAIELREAGLRVRIATRPPGRVASRRALAGIDPGGGAGERAARLGRGLLGLRAPRPSGSRRRSGLAERWAAERGQALPLVLGGVLALIFCSLIGAAFGGAVTGKSRVQRAADLAALSAARSMRDDFERLFAVPRLPDGAADPRHLDKGEYLDRARAAAFEAARRNGVDPGRLRLEFPDADSFAPLRARAEITAEFDAPPPLPVLPIAAEAEAEAVPETTAIAGAAPPGAPATASGGGYSGPLAYRQGEPMRPDVAAAFDAMAASARRAGLALIVNSGFRSDAEQAALFAANPDPQWVAPPGTSLHRCATELDLGPPGAYGWLAANAPRFGFVKRYSWEPWHFGFERGPAPCSAAGDSAGEQAEAVGEGGGEATALPAFVPARFREPLARASSRWNVSAALLAAQLMAESNFNPFAVSSAGAQGIAQFMPATAAAYGLADPLDPVASIDAQAHLMSDLLRQFGGLVPLALAAYNAGPAPVEACGCVPSYPETQAYVARILGLMDGAGALTAEPELEVRLVD